MQSVHTSYAKIALVSLPKVSYISIMMMREVHTTMAYARFNAATNKVDAIGCFVEKDHGKFFEYTYNPNPVRLQKRPGSKRVTLRDFDVLIYVGPHGEETRMAKIFGSTAYVIVDETDDGDWVVEKWSIKRHRRYA